MATVYWVGSPTVADPQLWDSDNWSLTDAGAGDPGVGAGTALLRPATTDDVVFRGIRSGVQIDSNVEVLSMDFNDYLESGGATPQSITGSGQLTIGTGGVTMTSGTVGILNQTLDVVINGNTDADFSGSVSSLSIPAGVTATWNGPLNPLSVSVPATANLTIVGNINGTNTTNNSLFVDGTLTVSPGTYNNGSNSGGSVTLTVTGTGTLSANLLSRNSGLIDVTGFSGISSGNWETQSAGTFSFLNGGDYDAVTINFNHGAGNTQILPASMSVGAFTFTSGIVDVATNSSVISITAGSITTTAFNGGTFLNGTGYFQQTRASGLQAFTSNSASNEGPNFRINRPTGFSILNSANSPQFASFRVVSGEYRNSDRILQVLGDLTFDLGTVLSTATSGTMTFDSLITDGQNINNFILTQGTGTNTSINNTTFSLSDASSGTLIDASTGSNINAQGDTNPGTGLSPSNPNILFLQVSGIQKLMTRFVPC